MLVHPAAIPEQPSRQQHYSRLVKGLNIMKNGQDPRTGPDHEYPDWLFDMLQPLPTLRQLEQKFRADEDSLSKEMVRGLCQTECLVYNLYYTGSAHEEAQEPGHDQGQQCVARKELILL